MELNLERNPSYRKVFDGSDPRSVIGELEIALGIDIDPKRSLLFLDEIQATPELFGKLRWFAEEMPELAVIAAGSLLELVLADQTFSMPVGCLQYRHVAPMGFAEYLDAHGQSRLLGALSVWPKREVSTTVHEKASEWLV